MVMVIVLRSSCFSFLLWFDGLRFIWHNVSFVYVSYCAQDITWASHYILYRNECHSFENKLNVCFGWMSTYFSSHWSCIGGSMHVRMCACCVLNDFDGFFLYQSFVKFDTWKWDENEARASERVRVTGSSFTYLICTLFVNEVFLMDIVYNKT